MTRTEMSFPRAARKVWLLSIAMVLFAFGGALFAQSAGDTGADLRGIDSTGGVSDRDNTRVMGTVLDSSQTPMTNVNIWVTNDVAPANRVRGKTRKTGNYLVRGVTRLYTRTDTEGIALRATFEKDGYQTVVAVVNVPRDGLGLVNPIMLKEGEADPRTGMSVLLHGKVTTEKGKTAKDARIVITNPANGEVLHEIAAEKNGEYQAFFWEAPPQVQLDVTSKQGSAGLLVGLSPSPNAMAILGQRMDVRVK